MARVNELLDKVNRLPALPATVLRLIPLLSDENTPTEKLLSLVQNDEGLAMAVMKLANSSAFGAPGRTFSLKESVVRLGRRRMKALVMEQQTASMFSKGGASFGMQRGSLWRGSLAGAFAAESLAESSAGNTTPDLAFLCALLRDVGKIVLDLHYGHSYLDRAKEHMAQGGSFAEAERAVFGFDHAELGAELAQRWRLPDRVVNAIRFHHDPPAPAAGGDDLYDIVHAADTVCLWAGISVGGDGMCYRLADHVRLSLDLDRPSAEHHILTMCDRLRQAEEELGILVPTGAAA